MSALKAAVLAAVEEQRLALAQIQGFDFTQEDGVVPRRIFRNDIAGEMRQSILDDGDARFSPTIANAETRVGVRPLFAHRKMLGERLLGIVQNANAEAPLRLEEGEQAALLIHTDGNQRWLEETEVKELTVIPWTLPGSRSTVTTVIPVAKCPMTRRKSWDVTEAEGIAGSFEDIRNQRSEVRRQKAGNRPMVMAK